MSVQDTRSSNMQAALLTVLLLYCSGVRVVYCQTVNNTWWPCSNLTPQANVDLSKVEGMWYLQENIDQRKSDISTTRCAAMNLTRTASGLTSLTYYNSNDQRLLENTTILVPQPEANPALWEKPDIAFSMMVVDLPADGSTLAITACHRLVHFEGTVVFSRALHYKQEDLDAVNVRLRTAGVSAAQKTERTNTTNCQEVQ